MHPFADEKLAARLEALAAEEMRRFVATAKAMDPIADAALLDVGGGVAAYLGVGSPVNQAVGIGMQGQVAEGTAEEIEAFFADRSQRGLVVLCPLAHHSFSGALSDRGWTVEGFENVLIKALDEAGDDPIPPGSPENVSIIQVETDEQRDLWAHVTAIGFSAPLEPKAEQLALGRIVSRRGDARLLLAYVNGYPAGTGEVFCEDGVAWLSADSTLPQFRRRGVQQALQLERLRIGHEEGCELAVSEAIPGSPSQRNMERLGFRVAYTRADVVTPKLSAR